MDKSELKKCLIRIAELQTQMREKTEVSYWIYRAFFFSLDYLHVFFLKVGSSNKGKFKGSTWYDFDRIERRGGKRIGKKNPIVLYFIYLHL
jgi:hypothetical protein